VRGEIDSFSRVIGRVCVEEGAVVESSVLRGPAVIGAGTVIRDSFIGPYTSVGQGCEIYRSTIDDCVVMNGARIDEVARIEESIIGQNVVIRSLPGNHRALRLMLGDQAEVLL
jgi:glucose-1-phosphate thymidylyltransferase